MPLRPGIRKYQITDRWEDESEGSGGNATSDLQHHTQIASNKRD
jgi:hypothetical protein